MVLPIIELSLSRMFSSKHFCLYLDIITFTHDTNTQSVADPETACKNVNINVWMVDCMSNRHVGLIP